MKVSVRTMKICQCKDAEGQCKDDEDQCKDDEDLSV